eukprot:1179836-Prorocentrum_minimum.AAC.2
MFPSYDDPRKLGASLAEFMRVLVGPERCVPVRERGVCTHCKQQAQEGAKLKQCARCRAVTYCGKECQRQHWRVHKPACTTKEQRIDHVIAGEGDQGPLPRCSRALAGATLDATKQHVSASRVLYAALTTGGLVHACGAATEVEEICSMMNLLFSTKLVPLDIENLLKVDPAIADFYAKRRKSVAAEEASRADSMKPVIQLCARIHESLVAIMPGISLQRYTGHDSPHSSNRDLVDYVHSNIAASYENIPGFLLLADECVAYAESNNEAMLALQECPFSPQQIRLKVTVLKKLVFSAWLQFSRKFEGDDDESTDNEMVKLARKRWFVFSFRELSEKGGPGMSSQEWFKQPGKWLPREKVTQ